MRKKKVLLIIPNRDVLLVRVIKVAKSLARNGYNVKILAWDTRGNRTKIEYIDGCEIYNFRFRVQNRPVLYLAHLLIWWPYIFFFVLRDDSDVFHPYNFFVLIPTIVANVIKRKKLVYDLADFYSDGLPPNIPKIMRTLLSWPEKLCLNFADAVIIVDEYRRRHVEGARIKKLEIVMNCPQNFSDKFGIQKRNSKFIIYCGGWLSERRGFKQIIKAIKGLNDIKVIVAGFGPDEHKLRSLFDATENVDFKGLVTPEESIKYTLEADVIFAFYDPQIPINRLASPNKLFDAMMCGKTILANSEAMPVANIVRKENCGLLVPYKDIQGVRDAILKLKKDSNLRTKMGENGRKAFEREYNWMVMERRLVALYDQIVGN